MSLYIHYFDFRYRKSCFEVLGQFLAVVICHSAMCVYHRNCSSISCHMVVKVVEHGCRDTNTLYRGKMTFTSAATSDEAVNAVRSSAITVFKESIVPAGARLYSEQGGKCLLQLRSAATLQRRAEPERPALLLISFLQGHRISAFPTMQDARSR